MKPTDFMVVTADQVASRRGPDGVPGALAALGDLADLTLRFERTVGDEIQGMTTDPDAVVTTVERLTRLGGWRIGIGIGPVEHPLPTSTREARGDAYLAAREAITRAHRAPGALALVCADGVGAVPYRGVAARNAESALVLLRWLLERRTTEGWAVVDLRESGDSGRRAAARLGITPSAVSQRLARAGWAEGLRARELASDLLRQALGQVPQEGSA